MTTKIKTYLEYLKQLDVVVETATDILHEETEGVTRTDAWDNHPADAVRTACQQEVERICGEVKEILEDTGVEFYWEPRTQEYALRPMP